MSEIYKDKIKHRHGGQKKGFKTVPGLSPTLEASQLLSSSHPLPVQRFPFHFYFPLLKLKEVFIPFGFPIPFQSREACHPFPAPYPFPCLHSLPTFIHLPITAGLQSCMITFQSTDACYLLPVYRCLIYTPSLHRLASLLGVYLLSTSRSTETTFFHLLIPQLCTDGHYHQLSIASLKEMVSLCRLVGYVDLDCDIETIQTRRI